MLPSRKLLAFYLSRLTRITSLFTGGALILLLVSIGSLLIGPTDKHTLLISSTIMDICCSLFAAICTGGVSAQALKNSMPANKRYSLSWALMTLALIINALSILGYMLEILQGIGPDVITPAKIGFGTFHYMLFAALFVLPISSGRGGLRLQNVIDALVTTLCVLGLSWFFLLGPAFLSRQASGMSFTSAVITLNYPFTDILVAFAFLFLCYRYRKKIVFSPLILLGGSILTQLWSNATYMYLEAQRISTIGNTAIYPFWFLSTLLIGIAAFYHYQGLVHHEYQLSTINDLDHTNSPIFELRGRAQTLQSRIWFYLPYVPFLIIVSLVIYSHITHSLLTPLLDGLTLGITFLLVIRHLFVLHEGEILLREREERRQEAENLRLLTVQLNSTLDLDLLLEWIAGVAVKELKFDTALLLFQEEVITQADEPISIQEISATHEQIQTHNVIGFMETYESLFTRESLLQLSLPSQKQQLPSEIQEWDELQQISTLLNLPLIYKEGRSLGCLMLGQKERKISPTDKLLARSFAEQATTAIEHARLYREVQEHEQFGKSLANIATRLNAAVAETAEIQELICKEAVTAFRADDAVLYVPDEKQNLKPIAIVGNNQLTACTEHSWGEICRYEQAGQVLYSLQPVLLQVSLKTPSRLWSSSLCSRNDENCPTEKAGCRENYPSLETILKRKEIYSAVLAPLFTSGEPVGLLLLTRSTNTSYYECRPFTPLNLSQVQDFAEQASVAFTNAHLYRQLRLAHQQLQKLDQMKDQFMVTASHELRTPLTSVQGYLELLVNYNKTLPFDRQQDFLLKAQRGCDELVLLLSNIMDASRLEIEEGLRPTQREKINLRAVVQHVLALFELQISQEKRQISVDIPEDLYVCTDLSKLRQVIRNVTVNALKYSPAETAIVIRCQHLNERQGSRDSAIVLCIEDRGRGIPPEEQEQLFQRFVRLDRDINSPVRGSGLGLYISRRLVEAMGGKIWVESTGINGEGSTFCVKLPIPA